MDIISERIKFYGSNKVTELEFFEKEIQEFKLSKKRKMMITGENYYHGIHDILNKKRTTIGNGGGVFEITNLPNSKLIDNQYKKMVDQKKNYLLGQPFTFKTENEEYAKDLKKIFNKRFMKLFKNLGEDSINCGIAWLLPFYDEKGEFLFKRIKPYEVIAGWKDSEHTILDYAIRVYDVETYEGKEKKIIEKVEIYKLDGIYLYTLKDGKLVPNEIPFKNYFRINNQEFNWDIIPLIAFKYNDNEMPLINSVKSLQDALNTIISNFQDNMLEDKRNTIIVLENFDGTDLGEFRQNLATYGAVKIKNNSSGAGDVRTLQVEVNSTNYQVISEILKKSIIENANGYDGKDDRLSGNPNQMNIMSLYSDIELDCNEMETEYQASLEDLLWFVKNHISNVFNKNYEDEELEIVFNRNIMISVSEKIQNINASASMLSKRTLLAEHPFVDDVDKELELLEKENEENNFDFEPAITEEYNKKEKVRDDELLGR